MSNFDAEKYSIVVKKERRDGNDFHVGRVNELPDIMYLSKLSFQDAYEGVIDAINTLREMAVELNREFPEPTAVSDQDYSGRITVRLEKTLHKQIAECSEAEGVSLNVYINNALIRSITTGTVVTAVREQVSTLLHSQLFSVGIGSGVDMVGPGMESLVTNVTLGPGIAIGRSIQQSPERWHSGEVHTHFDPSAYVLDGTNG